MTKAPAAEDAAEGTFEKVSPYCALPPRNGREKVSFFAAVSILVNIVGAAQIQDGERGIGG